MILTIFRNQRAYTISIILLKEESKVIRQDATMYIAQLTRSVFLLTNLEH